MSRPDTQVRAPRVEAGRPTPNGMLESTPGPRPRPPVRRAGRWLIGFRVAADAAMAILALAISYWFRFHVYPTYIPGGEPPSAQRYAAAAPVVALAVLVVFWFMDVYRWRRGVQFVDELFSVVRAMVVVAIVVLAMIGLYRDGTFTYSRATFVYWVGVTTVLILLARYALRRCQDWLRVRGNAIDRALVVGSGAAADLVIQRMRMFPDYGYQLVGIVTDDLATGNCFGGVDVLGGTGDLRRVIAERGIDQVFVASPELSPDRVLQLMDGCRDLPAEFKILPSMLELVTSRLSSDQLDGIPLLQFRHGLDMSGTKAAMKRAFDVVVAGLGLIVLSPLLGLIALVIRLDSRGPVLFLQERLGVGEREFRVLKFRSMVVNAEARTGPVWATSDDERRTRVGGFLRRFGLDELPQLWNILLGEMSMVGPRPERAVFVERFKDSMPRYADRHRVRPGLTGWAQVNDLRGQTPIDERLIYDLYYIENWSLLFDVKIILTQLFRVFTHKNAY